MEFTGELTTLSNLVNFFQESMATTAAIGLTIALGLAALSFLLRIAVAIAGGASGIVAAGTHYAIVGGIFGTILTGWPAIVNLAFQSIQDVSAVVSGSALDPVSTISRGFSLWMRTLDAAFTWESILPWNLAAAGLLPAAGFGVFCVFALLSLIVAAGIFMFWTSATIAPLLMGLIAFGPTSGIASTALAGVFSTTIYLTVLSVIIAAGEFAFEAALPAADATVTLTDVGEVGAAALLVLWLGFKASNYAATLTRGGSGGSGIPGAILTASSFGLSRAGAASAPGGGAGSSVSHAHFHGAGGGGGPPPGGGGGAAAAGGGGSGFGGGFGSGSGSVGRSTAP